MRRLGSGKMLQEAGGAVWLQWPGPGDDKNTRNVTGAGAERVPALLAAGAEGDGA